MNKQTWCKALYILYFNSWITLFWILKESNPYSRLSQNPSQGKNCSKDNDFGEVKIMVKFLGYVPQAIFETWSFKKPIFDLKIKVIVICFDFCAYQVWGKICPRLIWDFSKVTEVEKGNRGKVFRSRGHIFEAKAERWTCGGWEMFPEVPFCLLR